MNMTKRQSHLMKTFSKNIGMKIRENKCAYWNIKREIVIESMIAIEINPFMNLRFTEWRNLRNGYKHYGEWYTRQVQSLKEF